MPLPTPSLDDRHFQDIVDQAKLLIPRYCQEWTNHNVSDPGVTLIELFAWMTDMLLYRVNQIPDKNYIKFLEMIGMQLEEPRAATAPITLYLVAAQLQEVTIPTGTEVATVRTETKQAIIFTTGTDLVIRPPILIDAFTREISYKETWLRHDVQQAELLHRHMTIFPQKPKPGDAFLLAFETDHSNHLLALILSCERASGVGVDPRNPPIQWQVWQGGAARWVACELEFDGTGGFNESGEIILHIPTMARAEFQGFSAYWLRCLLTKDQNGPGAYKISPIIQHLHTESRGGTVRAHHAITIKNEVIGKSDGTPGQIFGLLYTPVLTLDSALDYLIVEPPMGMGKEQHWQEVPDFADSGPQDYHFTLDKLDGTLTFGPSLLQPDGFVYCFGSVPEKGSVLCFSRYRYGGGVEGNVAPNTLTVLKSSIPYIAHVTNRSLALGGRDAQSLEDARLRAPQKLRTRTRAVTADDYKYLATEVSGVARAHCLAPGAQPGNLDDPKPGQVFVIILPEVDTPYERISYEQLVLSAELRSAVLSYLESRCLLGTKLEVLPPQYIWVSVQANIRVQEHSTLSLIDEVQQLAEDALYRYLNPYVGGPGGNGWPFGRNLNYSELYGVLQHIEHVEFVEDIQMSIYDTNSRAIAAPTNAASRVIAVPRHGVICSERHQVKVH